MECNICGADFQTREELSYHREAHHTADVTCPECGVPFDAIERMRDHQRNIHPPSGPARRAG